ncbi:hypothetical protein D3C87_2014670 [compost metagenome]
MVAQPGQDRAIAVNRVDVIDQAFAEVEHLDQMSIFHRGVELLLQFASHHLDHLEVAKVVVEVVEQHVQQHIQRCVQGVPRP